MTVTLETAPSMNDRILVGGRAFVVAALMSTLVAVANALRLPPPPPDFWSLFLYASMAVSVAAGVVGFVVGSSRLNRRLGFLWGARKPVRAEIAAVVTLLVIIYAVVLFGWPSWVSKYVAL